MKNRVGMSGYRWWSGMLCAMLCVSLLAGCGQQKAEAPKAPVVEEQTPPEEPAPEDPVQSGDPEQAAFTAPLTGLPMDQAPTIRPLSIMINNAPAARPQSGLTQADIVYEVLAEGGITRMIGIFQSKGTDETIGPIRSIRPYLINLGESYGGVLVHAGGSNDAYAILQKQHKEDLDEIGNSGAYFWRDKSRKAPHNLYSSADKLREGADKHGYKKEVNIPAYKFRAESDLPEGEDATGVDITFLLKSYKVSYQYHEASKVYQRSINGKPHVDQNTGQQLTATNVVILGADHKTLDDVGRLAVDVDKGGEAVLLQRGKILKGRWVRAKGDVIRFVKDGQEVPLYPGTTYFNIVPNAPTFDSHIQIHQP
ncbi:DUF3048 domain-containing protein [Paenibacillus sp. HJL G12]|uniref:DUF3048 domain-containing protein n=1 Tax=Paenibacillus dendrobii TaxID=2691084 RepID=A0A7X3LJC7_9BACL|nr:DUF3048 domain-containing protein [Paenibacillus dendrobii]MWV47077.1 DUF3048 domain-containing protein [Paenibacillus dendrobii]